MTKRPEEIYCETVLRELVSEEIKLKENLYTNQAHQQDLYERLRRYKLEQRSGDKEQEVRRRVRNWLATHSSGYKTDIAEELGCSLSELDDAFRVLFSDAEIAETCKLTKEGWNLWSGRAP